MSSTLLERKSTVDIPDSHQENNSELIDSHPTGVIHHHEPQEQTLDQAEESEEEDDERKKCSLSVPMFVIFMILTNWSMYWYGVLFLTSGEDSYNNLNNFVSPPIEQLYFFTVTSWPNCNDVRTDYWRVLTYQCVHGSLQHLIGNTAGLVSFGTVFETTQSFGGTASMLIYQISVVLGCFGHAYVWPYEGLIGSSPGVYGLIGACWVKAFLYGVTMHGCIRFCLRIGLVAQLCSDILYYTIFYDRDVGFVSHFFGFLTGFSLALAAGICFKGVVFKIYGICGILILVGTSGWLISIFFTKWPPQPPLRSSFLRNKGYSSCCYELFMTAAKNDVSYDEMYCHNHQIYYYDDD